MLARMGLFRFGGERFMQLQLAQLVCDAGPLALAVEIHTEIGAADAQLLRQRLLFHAGAPHDDAQALRIGEFGELHSSPCI